MNTFVTSLIALAKAYIPILGASSHAPIERAFTVPEKDIRKLMGNASEEDKVEAVRLGRVFADAGSDFAVFVGSKGQIDAD
jgi:hypothetical protein